MQLRCGEALLKLGLPDESLPHLESAVSADPPLPSALEALGQALLDLERFGEAKAALETALGNALGEQQRMKIHYQLARVSRKLGDTSAERRHLQEFGALRAKIVADDK